MKIKEALKNKLTKKQLELFVGSYEIVGDIAIIEIPTELTRKQKLIAKTLLELHPNIKVILKKVGKHTGKYRTQKMTWLAGEKRKTAEHKESGLRMKLDVEKCYFSARLATERMRVASLIKPNERVLVMFSGVAPYPLVIAKYSYASEIVGVELNPTAHKFAEENVRLNKLFKITCIKGDCKKIVPKLGKFDRVIMCLPKDNELFLEEALHAVKNNGFLHFYNFQQEDQFSAEKVLKAAERYNMQCKVLNITKAGQHAPRIFRVCIDAQCAVKK